MASFRYVILQINTRMHLKNLLRYPVDYARARRLIASKRPHQSDETGFVHLSPRTVGRPILLDLRTTNLTVDCGRHLMAFAQWAARIGSPLSFRCSKMVLATIGRKIHGREFLSETDARWIDVRNGACEIDPDSIVLTDYNPLNLPPDDLPCSRFVQMRLGRTIEREIPVVPYPMHPSTMRGLTEDTLQQLRETRRDWQVFFAGNQKAKYGHSKMKVGFGLMSRLDILDTITEILPNRVTNNLPLHGERADCVLLDSRTEPISADRWLATLSRSRFFLCCPGSSQPMCHNLVEAMSVGTIPILEYAHRLTPELKDGVNAICFRGEQGLIQAMHRIDAMPDSEVQKISTQASLYYDRYLCGSRFLRRFVEQDAKSANTAISMPFHDRDFFTPIAERSVA